MPFANHNLLEGWEERGKWWFALYPHDVVTGRLKYDPAGEILLELDTNFTDVGNSLPSSGASGPPSHILGTLGNGRTVTLMHTYRLDPTLPPKFRVRLGLCGEHYNTEEEISFTAVHLQLTNLEQWMGQPLFSNDVNILEPRDAFIYTAPEPIVVEIPGIGTLEVKAECDKESDLDAQTVTMTNVVTATFTSNGLMNLYQTQRTANQLRFFFSLLMGRLSSYKRMTAKMAPTATQKVTHWNTFIFAQIESRLRHLHEEFMTYPLKHCRDRWASAVQKWFESLPKLEVVYDVFFGTFQQNRMFVESRFLHLMQAVESFHREAVGGYYLTDEVFQPLRKQLEAGLRTLMGQMSALPVGFRDKVLGGVEHWNEHSLKKRLDAIFSELSFPSRKFITWGASPRNHDEPIQSVEEVVPKDVGYFIMRIKDQRNYLTHLTKDETFEPMDNSEMGRYCRRLSLLMSLLLLIYLGFDETKTVEHLTQ